MIESDTRYNAIVDAVIDGDEDRVEEHVRRSLDAGTEADLILERGLTAGMAVVGDKFAAGEAFIPDVLWSASAVQRGISLLLPHLTEESRRSGGRVVIGTVQGDIHDIGMKLVALMLSAAGFHVVDLGSDVSPERFVEQADQTDAHLLCMSAMLTTTMPAMQRTLRLLDERHMRERVRVLVGGAPVTQSYADSLGADGWAIDASRAVSVAMELDDR
jgi:5-methyltetrahydrofolate--homocysteine methyltransferase